MPGGMADRTVDLEAIRSQIESKIPKEYKRGYDSIMAAGLKLMFSDKTFPKMKEFVDKIQSPEQTPELIAHGIAKALSILMNESQGHMPMEPAGAAAQSLMTHALDYVNDVKGIPITKDVLAATTKATNQGVMKLIQEYSGLDEGQFEQILRGKGKELVEASEQGPPATPQPEMMGA